MEGVKSEICRVGPYCGISRECSCSKTIREEGLLLQMKVEAVLQKILLLFLWSIQAFNCLDEVHPYGQPVSPLSIDLNVKVIQKHSHKNIHSNV